MEDLKERVALVTGASGAIGQAIAVKLVERAGRIALHYFRNSKSALAGIAKIKAFGATGRAFRANLASAIAAKNLVQRVEKVWERIDILVNNYGPFLERPWEQTSGDDWLALYRANVIICFELIKAVIPGMKARKWGRVINLGFHRAEQMAAFPLVLPYAAAKTSLLLLTKTAASSLIKHGITINMVSPGLIAGGNMPHLSASWETEEMIGKPEDIAAAVSFLASDEAGKISGANLIVAGTWKI